MDTKKYKTDHYHPEDWELTPSEKRLKAINPELLKQMKQKDEQKDILTKVMSEESIKKIKEEYDSEEYSLFRNDPAPKPKEDLQVSIETVFDFFPDPSEKVVLHSKTKDESDMIAVEPKNMSVFIKTKIYFRTFWLRFNQFLKRFLRFFILLILL